MSWWPPSLNLTIGRRATVSPLWVFCIRVSGRFWPRVVVKKVISSPTYTQPFCLSRNCVNPFFEETSSLDHLVRGFSRSSSPIHLSIGSVFFLRFCQVWKLRHHPFCFVAEKSNNILRRRCFYGATTLDPPSFVAVLQWSAEYALDREVLGSIQLNTSSFFSREPNDLKLVRSAHSEKGTE